MAIEQRVSAIAGRGWFTTEAVAIGATVEVDVATVNHSCDPTLVWTAGGTGLVAFRDVASGEELTLDYATGTTDPEMVVRCHCETYRCRQLVTGDDWRIPQLQQRYAGHLTPEVQQAVDAT